MDKLRKIDNIYSHNLANYLEDFSSIPDVKYFRQLIKAKKVLSDKHFLKIRNREAFRYY
jgi:hypothetical protein